MFMQKQIIPLLTTVACGNSSTPFVIYTVHKWTIKQKGKTVAWKKLHWSSSDPYKWKYWMDEKGLGHTGLYTMTIDNPILTSKL
jgi:hypothetical protein